MVEANVTHDGTDAFISTFGSTTDSHRAHFAVFSADMTCDNVRCTSNKHF